MGHNHGKQPLHDSIHFEKELDEHDSWFRHSSAEPQHQSAHGATSALGIIGFMGATLVAVLAVGAATYWGLFEPMMRGLAERVQDGAPVNAEFVSARAAAVQRLNGYEWAEPAKGTIRIPLDLAKRLQMEEHVKAAGGTR
jgi:hypothetical protein